MDVMHVAKVGLRRWRSALFLLALALCCAACGSEKETDGAADEGSTEATTQTTEGPADGTAEPAGERGPDVYQVLAEEASRGLRDHLLRRARPDDVPTRIDQRLQEAVAVALERQKPRKRPPIDLFYDSTLQEFYRARGFEPMFVDGAGLRPEAARVYEALLDAGSHGLNPEDYWLKDLKPLVEVAESARHNLDDWTFPEVDQVALDALAERLRSIDFDLERGVEGALDVYLEGSLSPELKAAIDTLHRRTESLNKDSIELEVRLADALLRYARDLHDGNLNQASPLEIAKYEEPPFHPKYQSEIVLARLSNELVAFSKLSGEEEVDAYLRSLWPQHEQYPKLREALVRYRNIVAAGGWPEVTEGSLKLGSQSKRVAALKLRLHAEGYYDGPVDNLFDQATFDAVSRYQETHQIAVTGESDKPFWRSLNLSAERRTEEIEVNLRRFHQGYFTPSKYFVYINIPDFHGELWRDGERVRRFKIVTGNATRQCDPETKTWFLPNATPIQHARMQFLVLNPYWNVPPRIEKEEYLPKILEDPQWLTKNGFEYYTDGPNTVLRQLPGENNALGKVKFIFPNIHSTFMHDTPKKTLFRYPIRAFSHGCMRVQDPLELAEEILGHEGKWTKDNQTKLDTGNNEQIGLDQPIDVFIEYYTVRVDEEGRVHFLADVYKYVKNEIRPPTAAEMRCKPEEKVVITRDQARAGKPAEPGTDPFDVGVDPSPDAPPHAFSGEGAVPADSGP
ncbi:MAG: hypothetical protein CO108_10145 [Deltaproteobacteria bacterium CG_4_9_14_3_um_filter_63_12]|nr:MAG: hypothetical protein CO108_10145 [Deltaproteobacteria bacterium CG_4_9_14_3_um_filter_63_12]